MISPEVLKKSWVEIEGGECMYGMKKGGDMYGMKGSGDMYGMKKGGDMYGINIDDLEKGKKGIKKKAKKIIELRGSNIFDPYMGMRKMKK